jgi:undecaprenyl-diphosphatase
MHLVQIILLAIIQGAAELLPVSSSAHVIIAEKLMGLDPSSPEMTFLLVMLHTGTMVAVMFYFWPKWRKLKLAFFKMALVATAATGIIGLGLKKFIEKVILVRFLGAGDHAEIEMLFKSLPLISVALFSVGVFIILADLKALRAKKSLLTGRSSLVIGLVQGLCLPFRGFSRSGATISTALLLGISRETAENFSFALAVILTPPVVLIELYRLLKATQLSEGSFNIGQVLMPGFLGMIFSFLSGFLALRWLSAWLEQGRWKYFGIYCILAASVVMALQLVWF